ncbi:hypothetical protein [Aquimarina sp. 2201CG14-23]|uniref:hypothetical protein n=1 Tax=Aquimarina mycalae TaxID=3040073 RepID=UPI0024782E5D|nr:hypothetical protein [Aquimarina sp. 2201CG14-23]MDH7448124.1 hypothetical protein [Aquimarina sp. 2201CG14-23]
MKRTILVLCFLLFGVTIVQAQIQITQCAPDDSLASGPTCEVVLPDYTGLVIAEDIMLPGAFFPVTQDPVPGTIITDLTTTVTFTADDGAGGTASCEMTFTLIPDPIMCFTDIPDNNFEQALIDAGYDSGPLDSKVLTANIASVTNFSGGTGGQLYNRGITDLTGIEDFVSLIQLSSNGNPLTSLDLSGNTNLEVMTLVGTDLTDLDLSANTKLLNVTVSGNTQLLNFNLSGNAVLRRLSIANSQLAGIDLSGNIGLETLFITDTPLSSIDLSANTSLTWLECNNNGLTNLDVSANILLERLYSNNNQLTSLDVSANVLLEELGFEFNQLSSIDLSTNTNLTYMYGNDNMLTNLDLSSKPLMEELIVDNNQLTSLNLRNGNNLSTFSDVTVLNNPNLSCIEVDDDTAANTGTGNYGSWLKDATASYEEVCTTCVIDGDIRIESQTDLDDFLVQLGSCNTINGNLTFRRANDVTDLSGLSGIEIINGKLTISVNDLLPNLHGFQNLKTVTDGFTIFQNDVLTDITALSGIADPITDFSISDNQLLTDISSVLDLTVTESLRVDRQTLSHALVFPNVTTLTGTNDFNGSGSLIFSNVVTSSVSVANLTMVENFFNLRNVDASTVSFPALVSTGRSFNLGGINATTFDFSMVQSLGSFTISNTQLSDLSPFSTVTSIGTSILITNNANLTSLAALNNVTTTTDVLLNVNDNASLVSLNGLDFISGTTGLLVIERNAMLTNIDALQSVTSTEYFRIKDNTVLTNVDGLENITETTETDMGEFLQSTVSGNALTTVNLKNLRAVANQLNIAETGVTDHCGLFNYVSLGDGATKLDLTGSNFILSDVQNCDSYTLNIKAFLQGAALNPNVGAENLMRDDLREAGLLPTTSPYGDGVTIDASVFNTTGNDAIVDWIQVAITDSLSIGINGIMAEPDLVLSGLVQRDGDIVSPRDGVSRIVINQSDFSLYARVAIRHRNHLTVSMAGSAPLSIELNFKNPPGSYFLQGTNSQTTIGMPPGVQAMWAGDVNSDGKINLIGSPNDSSAIRDEVLNDPLNIFGLYGFNINGYTAVDMNLNGSTQIIGNNNDANLINNNILNHPSNLFRLYGFTISEQLPNN